MNKSQAPKPVIGPEQPTRREIDTRRQVLQKKLDELRQYKALMALDGVAPDQEDKAKESKLIQQLLGLDKDLQRLENRENPQFRANKGEKTSFARSKKAFVDVKEGGARKSFAKSSDRNTARTGKAPSIRLGKPRSF